MPLLRKTNVSTPSTEAYIPPMNRSTAATYGLLATLVVLQRNGHLKIADVIAEIGSTIDFRRQQHLEAPGHHEALEQLYELMVHTDRYESQLRDAKAGRDGAPSKK
jgi:gamma-glutamyl:cysteine ligase YbdK (ATP-grasp superfamily)